jgi:hypothetical protein
MKKEAANASKIRSPDRESRRNGLATEIRERNGGIGLPLTHSLVSSSAGRDVNIRSQPILGRNCYKHATFGVRAERRNRSRGTSFYLSLPPSSGAVKKLGKGFAFWILRKGREGKEACAF